MVVNQWCQLEARHFSVERNYAAKHDAFLLLTKTQFAHDYFSVFNSAPPHTNSESKLRLPLCQYHLDFVWQTQDIEVTWILMGVDPSSISSSRPRVFWSTKLVHWFLREYKQQKYVVRLVRDQQVIWNKTSLQLLVQGKRFLLLKL